MSGGAAGWCLRRGVTLPWHPLTLAGAAALLVVLALLAAWVPARLDPLAALRAD